uniref:NADAR domain-containing protein n=1 Tax=viral metagenome TaxID=1070528 RepID=A0A6C0LVN7_9ZZZZ
MNNYIFFYGHKSNDKYNIFSQWYPAIFIDSIIGITYKNTEQYMMAHKALLFNDIDTYTKIITTSDPFTIKKLGRQVKNFDEKEWNKYKFDIVMEGNKLKFTQNKKLGKELINTGSKIIVEASKYDRIWGIGLDKKEAINIDPKKWPGKNLLGQIIMKVRNELKRENTLILH